MENIKANLTIDFKKRFDTSLDPIIVRSPGRVNIIGEHTDYNDGFVLPAAIDKFAYLAIGLRADDVIHLYAADLKETFTTTVSNFKPVTDTSWPNYLVGAAAQFLKQAVPLKGFNAILKSNVPMGAGLSSSAAVECAMVFGLNELLQTNLSRIEMVKMAQKAEHEYAGVRCGIMDQFASMMGKKDHVIKLDCRSMEYEYVPFKLEGIQILLLNSNVKHSLASSEYNTRRHECKRAVEWISVHENGVQSLRDVSEQMLDEWVKPISSTIDHRGRFVVQEIERLIVGCKDLVQGDIEALGKKMFETHDGLSKLYEVSCKELDFLIEFVRHRPGVIGARMMGGGFGGCTINLVSETAVAQLLADIKPAYKTAMHLELDHYIASIENGTEII